MSVNVHVPSRRIAGGVTVAPRTALAAAVGAAAVLRLLLVLGRATQGYFPDEYLYGELARSLAEGHGLRVLGVPGGWTPALLQPLITAPAWLFHDPDLAFRLTQTINVVAMSAGAFVVYALSRALSVSPWTSVAVACMSLASPDFLYTGYVTADAIAYTLTLVALLAAVRALAAPATRAQVVFLLAAGLATFARIQYAVLFVAAPVAALAVERWKLGATVRRHWLLALPFAGVVPLLGAVGLGRYTAVTAFGFSGETLRWIPVSAVLLTLSAGVVVIPGALVWTASEILHPSSRIRVAFASVTVAMLGMLLVASALMSTDTRSDRFFERYLMLGIPIAAIAFACWSENGRPMWRLAVVPAVILVVVAARVPVSQYLAGQGPVDSPTLLAVLRLQRSVGIGGASLLVALAATATAGVAVLAAVGRVGPRGALLLSASILAVVSAGAHSRDHRATAASLQRILGGTANWVDRAAGGRDVLLVESTREFPAETMLTALRNISITRMGLIGTRARSFDGAAERLGTTGTGILHLDGREIRQPIVVDRATTQLVFANAPARAAAGTYVLVDPDGPARLALMTEGLYEDGWLSSEGRLTLFGTGRAGTCRTASLDLTLPRGARPVTLTLSRDGARQTMRFRPGSSRRLRVVGASDGPAAVALSATPVRWTSDPQLRTVSVRAAVHESTAPCASAGRGLAQAAVKPRR